MGLLVPALIWALFVATTLWFPIRRGPWGFGIFVMTMSFNEIPLVLLVVFAISVGATLGDVAADGTAVAMVAVGVASLVVLGLVWLQVRARSARVAFDIALTPGLRSTGRASQRTGAATPDGLVGPWVRGILLPFQRHARSVERVRNVPYVPGGSREHLLDIYRRRDRAAGSDRSAGSPVLIHLHGGGFVQGGKSREGVTLLNLLAGDGWLCLSANHGLRSHGAFPRPLIDLKRAIAWVRHNAEALAADADRIFLVGASAGGHLALSAALTAGEARFQPGFEQADTSVMGAVTLYGYLGALSSDSASDPAALARPDAPPLLIVAGARDTAIPPGGARSVATALRLVSRAPVVYVELPSAQHGFDFFASVRARIAAIAVAEFLGQCLTGAGSHE